METRANHLIVGSFVLALLIGLVGFVLWLAGSGNDRAVTRYDIFFAQAITGLRTGDPVSYRGIPVGQISEIRIAPGDADRILVTADIDRGTPISPNTVATLALRGITGGAYVLLDTDESGALASTSVTGESPEGHPVIPSKASRIDQIIAGAPDLITRAITLLDQANEVFGPENRAMISATLSDLKTVSGAIAKNPERLDQIMADAQATMAEARAAAERFDGMMTSLQGTAGNLDTELKATLTELRSAVGAIDKGSAALMDELRGTNRNLNSLIDENRTPINDFTSNGLYELTSLLAEARSLVTTLNSLAVQIERDPQRFLLGGQQQGYQPGE
ncbi:MlaD family protein [Tistrella bauzanensis]|uniref:MlaD family protein n=1 Tax=Tistrella arctica TaxID=3133430 RepID=A0ABU9YDY3_9PROT